MKKMCVDSEMLLNCAVGVFDFKMEKWDGMFKLLFRIVQ